MELRVSSCRNICLSPGNHIPIFYLEQPNTEDLVGLHLCNARRDWRDNGNASFRSHHDRSERGSVRSWTSSHGALHSQATAQQSCFVKLICMEDNADGLDLVRHNPSAVTARLPKTKAPGIVSQPVNPEDSAAMTDQLETGHVLLIDVVGYSKLVREEKQP